MVLAVSRRSRRSRRSPSVRSEKDTTRVLAGRARAHGHPANGKHPLSRRRKVRHRGAGDQGRLRAGWITV